MLSARWSHLLLVLQVPCLLTATIAQTQMKNFHNILTQSEKLLFLGSVNKVPQYEVLERPFSSRRHKRSAEEMDQGVAINLTLFGQEYRLLLRPNKNLVSAAFQIRQEPYSNISMTDTSQESCFYQGECQLNRNCSAALSLCDGMRGVVETDDGTYLIQSLPSHIWQRAGKNSTSSAHLVIKQKPTDTYQCPHKRKGIKNKYNSIVNKRPIYKMPTDYGKPSRYKRSMPYNVKPAVIETAVFVDQALFDIMRRAFPADPGSYMINYILTIMNAVQLLYKQKSLGIQLDLSLVLLDILESQPQELGASDNIDTYLTNFCIWQHKRKMYASNTQPRWDHALLLSGINMYVVDDRGRRKRHVVGLAPVSGMCNPLNSCTISEGTSFQTVLVAGHEIGHSLGMEHDGRQDGNLCDPDHFIMSPTLGAGKTTWSTCSRQYLESFLMSNQAYCLNTLNNLPDSPVHTMPLQLPGQMFNADQQCVLRHGKGSRQSLLQPPEEICRILRCENGGHGVGVTFTAHPALEGTTCGRDRWCRGGRCMARQEAVSHPVVRSINGGWSAWSSFSSCYSDCVVRDQTVVGVQVSHRRCDNPLPQNGGRLCEGSDRKARICDASQICPASKHLPLAKYIEDTCYRASARDPSIEGRGTQFPSQDHSHSCYVWCHKRGGGFMTHGWKVPDGTPCWKSDVRQNRYCVNGQCQAFDCNGHSSDGITDPSCSLPSIPGAWSQWKPTSECRSSCIVGVKGFRIVNRECNTMSGCPGHKESFQLCSSAAVCSVVRTVDEYANEVCRIYSNKYPSLLSGQGRQLPSREGSRNSACVVACQDKVWKDTHYQMDVFEDGMFPFGTDCSGRHPNFKAYCLNGRCLEFDDNGSPVDNDLTYNLQIKKIIRGVWKRDLMSNVEANEIEKPFKRKENKTYQWGVIASNCSTVCGGGVMHVSVFCHIRSVRVPNKLCVGNKQPTATGWRTCNTHSCTGRWRVGEWSLCSATCGAGVRTRAVVCVRPVAEKVFSLSNQHLCPSVKPAISEPCILPTC